jgi:DNA-binding transcriptional LysR family regulator
MFDWSDLQYFLAVARHRSTIAARKSPGLGQSTMQRRLAELERAIGQRLVKRHQPAGRISAA